MPITIELEPVLIASVQQNRLQFYNKTFKEILTKVGSLPVSIVSIIYPNGGIKDQMFTECLKYLSSIDKNHDPELTANKWKTRSDADPKGIYLWPEPKIIRKSCEEVAVLIMEVNACSDLKKVTREDLMLFALSSILSSTVICTVEDNFTDDIQDLLQLFGRFGRGGVGTEFNETYLNLIVVVNNWSPTKRYTFGYFDHCNCPPNGDNTFNYRRERLNTEFKRFRKEQEQLPFKNKLFVDSYYKIGFCLMPNSSVFDFNSNIMNFSDLWQQITVRLFHPSNLSVKHMIKKKFREDNLVRLFEGLSIWMTQIEIQNKKSEELNSDLKNLKALSVALNYYKLKMNREIENKEYLKDSHLNKWHNESLKNAINIFDTMRGNIKSKTSAKDNTNKYYKLFDKEIQNIWHFYQDLNKYKLETVEITGVTPKIIADAVEEVVIKKKEFDLKANGVDFEMSQLIGINLDQLSNTVLTATQ